MYSSEDLEKFYFQYQTEAMPKGISYSLFEKKFVSGYQFMKVEREGGEAVYRIDWKDVVLLLENPIVSTLKIR